MFYHVWLNVNWFKVTIFALKRTKNDLGERKRTIIERKSMLVDVASIAGEKNYGPRRITSEAWQLTTDICPAADHV